jgi:hypothetical protein
MHCARRQQSAHSRGTALTSAAAATLAHQAATRLRQPEAAAEAAAAAFDLSFAQSAPGG